MSKKAFDFSVLFEPMLPLAVIFPFFKADKAPICLALCAVDMGTASIPSKLFNKIEKRQNKLQLNFSVGE
jgi:hypothetical protein